ncbi:plasmid pRiA4b ORF-3 family protein [Solwaraspora sp. WMMB335]|uniref:plasmid pRiA4b ORF-3 family protein n=1 Tax=Solwaraspora sp. WMMB335 TaxID=3404118 RepID=UPI003B93CB8C
MDPSASNGPCDCPGCTGELPDPGNMIEAMLAATADLVASDDPLEAEIIGAMFVSLIGADDPQGEQLLVDGLIPQLAARASAEAHALLLAIASVAPPAMAATATAAAAGIAADVPQPKWATEITTPVTVGDCWYLTGPGELASILAADFQRAGREHAVMVFVDHTDCGAAQQIALIDGSQLPQALAMAEDGGLRMTRQRIEPADFRWHVEQALNARAVHDEDVLDPDLDDPEWDLDDPELDGDDHDRDELGLAGDASPDVIDDSAGDDDEDAEGPDFASLAALLRTRLSVLPAANRPALADHSVHAFDLDPDEELTGLPYPSAGSGRVARQLPPPKLPGKRKKSHGPAPIYRVRVELVDSEPLIWRELEVPGDIPLERLHAAIQVAFGWNGDHLHEFDTSYGEFGPPDNRAGQRSERKVTLEQVAATVGDTVTYLYDFGDGWTHDVRVETITDHDPQAGYPRCTGGECAAPPDDCGGVWGYAELVGILGDPSHPEHAERRQWLGLDDGTRFDPHRFDLDEVDRRLAYLR